MQAHTSNKDISISARRLAEIIHRDGGLATPTYAGIDSLEGIKIHQKFTQYLKKQNYIFNCSELSLHSKYTSEKLNLKISGRLDNLSFSQDSIKLYEIKSFRGHSMFLPDKGDPLHWAQLKIYAYLLKKSDPQLIAKKLKTNDNRLFKKMMDSLKKDSIKLNLVYIAIDHHEIIIKEEIFSWQEINEFMQDTCEQYLIRMHNIISWQNLRNQAARESKFPFEHLRDGQAEMMRQTLATMRDKGVLLAQAPTGIGKTMAVLYPSLKALSTNYVQRIFYATAMIATRDIARQSLEILRENGFLIRSILLQAKEKICTQPDLFCDQSLCPFAVDYYQRLPDGIQALLPLQNISPEIIREVALKYQLCPHELSLDFSYFCDLIIGDYNHIFDPQAKLSGFFENPDEQTAILVDEAHNLPSRATTMYSAGISGQKFIQVRKILKNPSLNFIHAYSQLINNLELTINEFNEFSKIFQLTSKPKSNNFFTEKNNQWLIDQNFIGIKQKPDLLLKKINSLVFQIRDFLDEQRLFEGRRQLLDFWFDLLFFTRVADFYFDQAYITAFRIDKNGFLDSYLLALDASKYITESYLNKHPTIFFSATLSPIHYYHSLLNSESREQPAETLQLSSPFPSENRLLAALTKFSVKFKDRQETMPAIINFIYQACLKKTGNYLIFVPSYQYLFQLEKIVKKQSSDKDVDLMFQNRNMNQFQKDRFIQRFDSFGRKTLLAFAVLGSHFNEGIDLQGENLSGVFVIGTGLPQISPEREIMTQYYSEKYNAGRAYGYQYPGFNRVQQAVGRLIRSEKDIGFAILIDDRYLNPEWQEIFPNDWLVGIFEEDEDLLAEIEIFWQDH